MGGTRFPLHKNPRWRSTPTAMLLTVCPNSKSGGMVCQSFGVLQSHAPGSGRRGAHDELVGYTNGRRIQRPSGPHVGAEFGRRYGTCGVVDPYVKVFARAGLGVHWRGRGGEVDATDLLTRVEVDPCSGEGYRRVAEGVDEVGGQPVDETVAVSRLHPGVVMTKTDDFSVRSDTDEQCAASTVTTRCCSLANPEPR